MFPIQIEDLYRLIVETAYEGIWILDAEMRTQYVNERMAEMLGYQSGEMLGRHVFDFVLPDEKNSTLERLERRRAGISEEFEVAYLRRDGSRLWAHVSTNPLRDEHGAYLGALGMVTDITEKKRAENALRENENLLRLITDGLPALVAYIDREQRYRFANELYRQWFVKASDEVVGRHVREIVGAENYRKIRPEIERALAGEKLVFERLIPYGDGRRRYVQAHYIPHFEGDRVRGFFALIVDISERKQAEEDSSRSEERYRAFVANSSEGIWRIELEQPVSTALPVDEQIRLSYEFGVLAECNDAMARMYGYETAAEIAGTRLGDLLPAADESNIAYLRAFIEAGYRLENGESREVDRDGRQKVFLNNLVGVVENGFFVRAWGTQRDVTETMRAGEALRESEERYRIVAETASDAIISIDEESRIVFVNTAATRVFGYPVEAMLGQDLSMLMPEHMRGPHLEGLWHYLETGRRKSDWKGMEVTARHADGREFPLEVSFDEYDRDGRRYFIGVARDISERKKNENATAHLAAIVKFSSEAIISKTLDGIIASWNGSAERTFGYTAAEIVGRPITTIIPSDRIDEEEMIISRIKAGRTLENYETVRRRKDGSEIDVSLSISPIQDETGRIIGVSKIARDISERKAARAVFDRYRLLLMQARDIILFMREDGRIVEANKAAVETYGYDYETLLTLRIHDLRAPETLALLAEQYARASEGGLQFETIHRRRDGTEFPVEVSSIGSEVGGERFLISIIRDISERRRTEAALHENQVTLSLAMRSSRMGAWERDVATGVVNWSEELEAIFGLEKGAFGGDEAAFYELLHEDDRLAVWDEVEKAVAERRDYTIEFRFYHKDGSVRWMEGRGQAVYSEKGEPVRIYGIGIDITERRRAEAALRESEAEFRQLANALPQIVWVAGADGRAVYVNEQWTDFSGLTLEDTRDPEKLNELYHPEDRGRVWAEWESSFAAGALYEVEARMRRRDGEYRWFLIRSQPVREDGRIVRWFGTSTDITENKLVEIQLRESETRFRNMADHAPVMVWMTDASGACTYLSQSWYEFTGQTAETGLGFGWIDAVHPDDRAQTEATFLEANARQAPFRLEYRVRGRDGVYRWAIDSAQPRFDEHGAYLGYVGSVVDIDERRAAEEKVRENESTLRAYYNSSPLMMGIVEMSPEMDGDLLHVYDNPATCLFFGAPPDSTAGRRASELGASPQIVRLWSKNYRKSQRLNRPVSFEYKQAVRGEPRWLSVTVSLIGSTGETARFAYVAEDTTERKLAESQIRYQLDLTQTITDNTQSCLLMMDSEGRGTFANYATERVTGFKPEELIGRILHEMIHHTHPDGTPFPKEDCPLDNALPLQEAVVGYEDVFVHKDGHFYPVRCNGRPISKDGKPVGTVIEVLDITEEKTAREALLKAERRAADEYQALLQRIVPLGQTLGTARDLASIYRAMHEFICSSMDCSAFFVSSYDARRQRRVAEYAWGEGVELDVSQLPPIALSSGGGANSQAVFQKKTIITNNYWEQQQKRPHLVLEDNGVYPQSSLVVPMMIKNEVFGTIEVQAHRNEAFNAEHAVALEMVANLAAVAIENVRLLEVEAAARREAEAANRAKDEFLSVLSHELRTPLNSMLGWVRMLKSGLLDEEKSVKAVEVIERNTLLQNNLIEDLLDVSRIISGKMRIEKTRVDLVKVFSDAVDILRPGAAQKHLDFEFRTREAALPINGDATRLQQIISNLVQNAIKFTPEHGRVSVRLSRRGNYALLVVEDDGIGIGRDILPHIFERFQQADSSTKRVYSGLGLGLTIVRNLVELHRGTIEAASEGEGKGARFTVEIPLAEDFTAPAAVAGRGLAAAGQNGAALPGARILLVDDDLESLIPLRLFLEKEKAEIVLATSAGEALDRLAAQRFDVLITDIGMPHVDGYELIAKVRQLQTEQNAFVIAIALTAYASTDDRRRALAAGFQGHFAKPVDYEELLATIREFYEKSR